jgi:seryl-tRNA synthetase
MKTTHTYRFNREVTEQAASFIADAIERTYDVEHIDFSENFLNLVFREAVSTESFDNLVERLDFISAKMTAKSLFENHPERNAPKDPFDTLLQSGDVQPVGRGLFMLQGQFLKLFQYFNEYWRKKALELGAVEQDNPAVWPAGLYRDINYIAEFPHQIILASPVKQHNADLTAMAQKYSKESAFDHIDITEHMAPSDFGLQSAVCDTCYYVLRGKRGYGNTLYTTYNKVFRNECSETNSLDRLTSFTVRDIMFVGDQKFVMQQRQKMIELAIEFLAWLDLDSSIAAANDPFFTDESMIKAVYQNASELKYELLVKLPFSGKELAVGSINLHQDFFGQAFDIKLPDGGFVWSGCLGIGFERIVYALYAQYGTGSDSWPAHLSRIVEN